jgi:hypothetical protein
MTKCYAAIFICLATMAIHSELVSSVTTEAFKAVLRRFTARGGKPLHICSENATNLIGAKVKVKVSRTIHGGAWGERKYSSYSYLTSALDGGLIHGLLQENSFCDISEFLAADNRTWHLPPPNAPHFGGLWEAAVKSI